KLRIARQNCLLPDFKSIESLPVRRLNHIQRDLEKLHVFLLTGNMPWHVDTTDAQVHEKILRNVLQEAGTSLVSLVRRLSIVDRALFIKRLASQFPKHHLENVLIRIAPTQADWILDFLCVYQSAILNTDFIPGVHAELSNSVWEQLFAFFLEENQEGDHPTQSLSKLVKRLALTQKQDPNVLMGKMAQAAERSMREGQIKSALVTTLQALTPDMPAISVQNQASEEALALDTQAAAIADARQRQGADESLYFRILTALHEAGLIAAIADFSSDTTQAGIEQLTQHLRSLTRSSEQLAQWVNRLAQPILLDITYLLSASAAVLIEQLLAQSEILYRQPVSVHRVTKAQWKHQLWCASLNYLLAEPDPNTEPGAYMQALARGLSGEAQLLPTLRAWSAALEQKKAYGTIHTLLQTLTIDMPALEQVEGGRVDAPAIPLKGSAAYQALHRRLSAEHSSADQPDIRHLLQALMAEDALQLQRIYQDLGRNRYDLAAARLNPGELLGLIEFRLRTESAMASDDGHTFLQAVEAHASQLTAASHLSRYYRQILADLLQAREIDLEMIALQVQATVEPSVMSNDDQRKDAKPIATQESGRVEVATAEGSGKHAETANLLPITPSTLAGVQKSQTVYGPWYLRILAALRDAGLADEEFKDAAMDSPQANIERFKQHLRTMLRTAQQRARLAGKLPHSILLDITYLLAPLAAALIEQILAQAETLYRQPASFHRVTKAHWKQQLWIANLDYLLAELHPHIEPVAYIRALARGLSGEAQLLPTLRAWSAALEQKKAYGTIHTILQSLIIGAAETDQAERGNADSSEAIFQESLAYQQLHQRLNANHSSADQPDIRHLLQALAAEDVLQLQRIYQDLGRNRYDLAAARLSPAELLGLIEFRLKTESAMASDDGYIFLQAVEAHASPLTEASRLSSYYQQVLEDLLQAREIDLEMIALQVQAIAVPSVMSNDDQKKDAKPIATQESGGIEVATAERSGEHAETANLLPITPSTLVDAQKSQAVDGPWYLRILAALRDARLADEEFKDAAMDSPQADIERFKQHLHTMLRTAQQRARLAGKLPFSILLDITYLLAPLAAALIEQILAQAETLYRQPASLHRVTKAHWKQQLWIANLDYLLAEPHPHIEPVAYIRALARGLSGEAQLLPTLRAWCVALEQKKVYGTLHKLLQTLIDSETGRSAAEIGASLPIDLRGLLMKVPSVEILEEIYIHNAGQVLAAPYLPRLFTMLNLMEDGVFFDRRAVERAVHLLQFMVNEQTQTPEYQLTLNKVLCGITTGIPIDNRIDISEHEKKTIEGLMLGMIQNWKTIGNTSISGLRQTFLQRKGRLHLKEDGMWYLTIEPGTFDMLLDSLPWSYSVIKHAWMERAIHVTWR
ncbi:MAG TPA: contractile injection system tape measure protein, partial [Nitrosomonas sp.]|nr:contractile injection system tape measure protein [Nitrosomonas sp.]